MKTLTFKNAVLTVLVGCTFTSFSSLSQAEMMAPEPLKGLPSQLELSAWSHHLNKMAKSERDPFLASVLFDQFEVSSDTDNPISWEMNAWAGTDWNKVYFNSEGEQNNGKGESENQLLYSRPIAPFWDIQLGVEADLTEEDKLNTWGVIGVQGLAPYFFETRAYLVANMDNIGFKLDAEYEALFTQKLILTPQFKLNAYSSDQTQYGIGSGISSMGLGLRLRYEITRKFAPYIGIKWNKTYGKTADLATAGGGKTENSSAVAGLRFWF